MTRFVALTAALTLAAGPSLAQQTPEDGAQSGGHVRADAQTLATRLALPCRVSDARIRGVDDRRKRLIEVACRDADGFLVHDTETPSVTPCLMLVGRSLGMSCELPANRNGLNRIRSLARQAGVTCDIDQSVVRGDGPEGGRILEIGCRDEAGYWVADDGGRGRATPCLVVTAQGGDCGFTTPAEILASATGWATRLGDDCVATQARDMGGREGRRYVELSCRNGSGRVLVLAGSDTPEGILSCDQASDLGGGCRL